jgi:hypothetical protein
MRTLAAPHSDMEAAKAMLLKSVQIAANSNGDPARIVRTIRTALADLDARLLAGDWLGLARNAAWLIEQTRRGQH